MCRIRNKSVAQLSQDVMNSKKVVFLSLLSPYHLTVKYKQSEMDLVIREKKNCHFFSLSFNGGKAKWEHVMGTNTGES